MRDSVHSMADCLLDWFSAGEKIDSEFVSVFMNMVCEGGACEA